MTTQPTMTTEQVATQVVEKKKVERKMFNMSTSKNLVIMRAVIELVHSKMFEESELSDTKFLKNKFSIKCEELCADLFSVEKAKKDLKTEHNKYLKELKKTVPATLTKDTETKYLVFFKKVDLVNLCSDLNLVVASKDSKEKIIQHLKEFRGETVDETPEVEEEPKKVKTPKKEKTVVKTEVKIEEVEPEEEEEEKKVEVSVESEVEEYKKLTATKDKKKFLVLKGLKPTKTTRVYLDDMAKEYFLKTHGMTVEF